MTKAQLDGSPSDPRYADDFFVDLIFAPISKSSEGGDLLSGDNHLQPSTDNGLLIDSSLTDKYEQSLHKDARFWESITARKLRTKKRKQRKFAANEQDQFRIAEDSKFFEENEDGETSKVSFFSVLTTSSQATAKNKAADEELIKQLAMAERDEQPDLLSSSSPAGSTSVLTSGDSGLLLSTPMTKGGGSGESGVVAELQALEDLEKELGLGDLQLFSTEKLRQGQAARDAGTAASSLSSIGGALAPSGPSAGVGTSQTSESGAVDDLDELEKYLQSLSSGTA